MLHCTPLKDNSKFTCLIRKISKNLSLSRDVVIQTGSCSGTMSPSSTVTPCITARIANYFGFTKKAYIKLQFVQHTPEAHWPGAIIRSIEICVIYWTTFVSDLCLEDRKLRHKLLLSFKQMGVEPIADQCSTLWQIRSVLLQCRTAIASTNT